MFLERSGMNALLSLSISAAGSAFITITDKVLLNSENSIEKFILVFFLLIAIYFAAYFFCKKLVIQTKGVISYNMNINASSFRFPDLFQSKYETIFLVGPNQNFILNLEHNKNNFRTLISSLSKDKKVCILISDLSLSCVKHMYGQLSAKNFPKEANEILHSINLIDNFITTEFGTNKLSEIKINRSLEIKSIDLWLDSFCFVNGETDQAKGYLMLVTKDTPGGDRPIYYFSKKFHQELFNAYYQKYFKNIYEDADLVWPKNSK